MRNTFTSTLAGVALVAAAFIAPPVPARAAGTATPISVYGAWHCGNDYCTWGSVRTMTDFDAKNHWLIDRGGGTPSVNLVVLSFVHPLRLLNKTDDAQTVGGVPKGMTPEVVNVDLTPVASAPAAEPEGK